MTAANHPAGKGLACQLCLLPPNPITRLKQPLGDGYYGCPYCDPHLFQPSRRTERD